MDYERTRSGQVKQSSSYEGGWGEGVEVGGLTGYLSEKEKFNGNVTPFADNAQKVFPFVRYLQELAVTGATENRRKRRRSGKERQYSELKNATEMT